MFRTNRTGKKKYRLQNVPPSCHALLQIHLSLSFQRPVVLMSHTSTCQKQFPRKRVPRKSGASRPDVDVCKPFRGPRIRTHEYSISYILEAARIAGEDTPGRNPVAANSPSIDSRSRQSPRKLDTRPIKTLAEISGPSPPRIAQDVNTGMAMFCQELVTLAAHRRSRRRL